MKKYRKKKNVNADILIISDMHYVNPIELNEIAKIENKYNFDFYVLLGDIVPEVLRVVSENATKPIFAVGGNHDTREDYKKHGIIYLNESYAYFNDLVITGIDGSHKYKNPQKCIMKTQKESINATKDMSGADILISHDSAYHIFGKNDNNCGLKGITRYIKNNKPTLHLHGHYHTNMTYRLFKTNCICTYRIMLYKKDGTLNPIGI